jgi:DNA-binding transcriptional LysR family regulator
MPLPLDTLPVFLTVAEEGNFASAGRKLNLSRSAIGKSVARLEAQIGARLIHRSTRSHALTPEGELLYEGVRKAMSQIEAIASALKDPMRQPAGRLRVTAPVAIGRFVAAILHDLARRHPELSLQIAFTDRIVDLIEEGIDLAVRLGPLSNASTLATRRIARMDMLLCAAPEYVAGHGLPSDALGLRKYDGIFYARGRHIEPWKIGAAELEDAVLPRRRIKFDDLDAICNAAVAGLGLAWLPKWLLTDHLQHGRLAVVLPQMKSPPYNVHAIWPRSTPMPLRLRLAVNALAEHLQEFLNGDAVLRGHNPGDDAGSRRKR